MKKHLLWIFPLMLIVTFQNCGNPKVAKQEASDRTATRKAVADPYSVKFLDYYKNRYYTVDADTGYMSEYDLGQVAGQNYCLTPADQAALKSILKEAEVCIPEETAANEDTYCTMAIVEPYASLKRVGEDEILLGYASDGCATAVDLCGKKASEFRSFIAATLTNLSSKSCSN